MINNINNHSFIISNDFNKNSLKDYMMNESNVNNIHKNFLNILVEQIKNQNPLNPIEKSDLTSQLTQIDTATNIQKIEKLVSNLFKKDKIKKNINTNFPNINDIYISHANFSYNKTNDKVYLGFVLNEDASSVDIKIINKNGKLIYFKNLGFQKKGIHKIVWNGQNNLGKIVPKGKYELIVIPTKNNKLLTTQPLTYFNQLKLNNTIKNKFLDLNKI
ncbi:basal-body rod modification protein [Buchnera aphidicola (Nipponaphis monzeni)]|uniref:Basal-body rod modification protein FlgD n=1 Tax=Buchnera aphidicola (Nipponaphis monzeni) TaxID=2495405 RepID=A0A455TAF4_9GAMM|nr:FlgD immunoglobulin-like domain containing protein [Buchnera aphidicola]BBI01270.1 basal-body rod modification protein [Buchnera aphidicola (Nipponaphis monzeni)]